MPLPIETPYRIESCLLESIPIGITDLIANLTTSSEGIAGRLHIDKDEEEALKNLAAHLLSLSPQAIEIAQSANELIEVDCNEKNEISDT
ncbi:MAG: hypothetical protein PHD39_10140 [Methylobacter tundripaludum]|nr:hypothetical protein [Methylobacter tundripaludum]